MHLGEKGKKDKPKSGLTFTQSSSKGGLLGVKPLSVTQVSQPNGARFHSVHLVALKPETNIPIIARSYVVPRFLYLDSEPLHARVFI